MYDDSPAIGPLLIGDRPLPHSAEMENAVLSCVIQEPGQSTFYIEVMRDTDFYIPANRRLFETIRAMMKSKKPIDLMTLTNALDQRNLLEDIGGVAYLRKIANTVPSIANLQEYIRVVRNCGKMRRLIGTCSEVAGKAFESEDAGLEKIISDAEKQILEISRETNAHEVKFIGDFLPGAVETIRGKYNRLPEAMGYSTGYSSLDRIVEGLKNGDMYVIAARPSIGKTTFALNMCMNLSIYQNLTGALLSLEMKGRALTEKMVYMTGQLHPGSVLSREISEDMLNKGFNQASASLANCPLIIEDSTRGFEEICHHARYLFATCGIKYLAFDYLQLATSVEKFRDTEPRIAYMSAGIKALASELDIPIIVLAQLNRISEGKRPKISELRGSGAIEQDADGIWLLHRERESHDEALAKRVAEGKGVPTDLIVAKSRNGATGMVNFNFFPQYSNFQDIPRVPDSMVPSG